MKKKLCEDAKECIKVETRNEVEKEMSRNCDFIIKIVTKEVSNNIISFLKINGEKLYEKSRNDYRKRIRTSVTCMLEGYRDLKSFVENSNKNEYGKRVHNKINKMIRSNEPIYARF